MNEETPRTVFLIDDDPAVRESLSMLLESEGYTVAAFASGVAFLAAYAPGTPGCALLDLHMPDMDGLQLQAEMARRGLALPIVFLTGFGDIPTTVTAIKAGAVDFLSKAATSEAVFASVAAAMQEDEHRRERAHRNHSAAERLSRLTERERAVMRLAVQGLANKEIARRLGISHRTVEIHKAQVMKKTGTDSVVELARVFREAGNGE